VRLAIRQGLRESCPEFREKLTKIRQKTAVMPKDVENYRNEPRSLGEALADLQVSYKRRPKDKDLAQMIAHAKAEIADRQRTAAAAERGARLSADGRRRRRS